MKGILLSICFTLLLIYSIEGGCWLAEKTLGFPLGTKDKNLSAWTKSRGTLFDRRAVLEVVEERKKEGIEAAPVLSPYFWLENITDFSEEIPLYPLSSWSNKLTIGANESGEFGQYKSDRYGFNNLDAWYEEGIDLALVGDSYVECAFLQQEESLAYLLRGAGIKAGCFGKCGTGPLIQLAILREYVKPLAPKQVVWFYFAANDFIDLERERANPIIDKYKQTYYNQNLLYRINEIDAIQGKLYNEKLKIEARPPKKEPDWRHLKRFIFMDSTKEMLRRLLSINTEIYSAVVRAREQRDAALAEEYIRIILQGAQEVHAWGGNFVVVDLSGRWGTVRSPELYTTLSTSNSLVLNRLANEGIPIINCGEFYDTLSNPKDLFPNQYTGHHFGKNGYEKLAAFLVQKLKIVEKK
jgi:hypothetical protein